MFLLCVECTGFTFTLNEHLLPFVSTDSDVIVLVSQDNGVFRVRGDWAGNSQCEEGEENNGEFHFEFWVLRLLHSWEQNDKW